MQRAPIASCGSVVWEPWPPGSRERHELGGTTRRPARVLCPRRAHPSPRRRRRAHPRGPSREASPASHPAAPLSLLTASARLSKLRIALRIAPFFTTSKTPSRHHVVPSWPSCASMARAAPRHCGRLRGMLPCVQLPHCARTVCRLEWPACRKAKHVPSPAAVAPTVAAPRTDQGQPDGEAARSGTTSTSLARALAQRPLRKRERCSTLPRPCGCA